MNEKTNWIAHMEWLSLLVSMIGGFYILDGKIERQMARTDRLYELYCDTAKEGTRSLAELRKDMDQKFYDILKETKGHL